MLQHVIGIVALLSQSMHSQPVEGVYTTKCIDGAGIIALVPEKWVAGCVVPDPNLPKREYKTIDAFIASSLPLPPSLACPQPDPLSVSILRITSDQGPLPNDLFHDSPKLKKLGVQPCFYRIDGFHYTKYGPYIDKSSKSWEFVVIICNANRTEMIVIGTSEKEGKTASRVQLQFIVESVRPQLK